MTPGEFITKWKAVELKERSAAQSHFNDLCRMLDEPGPTDADPTGEWYCFEKGATKSTGGWLGTADGLIKVTIGLIGSIVALLGRHHGST